MYAELELSHAVPFKNVLEAIEFMQYGTDLRVMFEMLFLTGCRIHELNSMETSNIVGNRIYWKLGKNQHTSRVEVLPLSYLKELKHYREHNRVYGKRMFGISGDTFRRYFNKDVRPRLSEIWQRKVETPFDRLKGRKEYLIQLKGLRKDFQTLEFAKQLKKWKSSEVALEFTSKRMKHSSKKITAYHYIVNFDTLNINDFGGFTPSEILADVTQTKLVAFF